MTQPNTTFVLGIDPGLAACGYAVVGRLTDGRIKVAAAGCVTTKKQDKKKVIIQTRVNVDDQARLRMVYDTVRPLFQAYGPRVMGVESYAPSGPNSNGWKAALAYGLVSGIAMTLDVQLIPHIPQDLKRKIAGQLSASKLDVQNALCGLVVGLESILVEYPKGEHEHIADAVGHAYLALLEVEELAKQVKGFV